MLINGIESDKISAIDRGLAYGDGLFSTMKVEYGQVQLWDFHLQRLQLGVKKLFFPAVNWSQLSAEVLHVAKTVAHEKQSVIKIILTRGSGGRGYSTQGCDSPQRIISTSAYPDFYKQWQEQGIKLILCESQLGSNSQLAGLKTLNRLEQVLIKKELENKQATEGIVCDNQGVVIETCSANLFIYLDNVWQTPLLDRCGVAGVQRRQVMLLAKKAGIEVVETELHINALKRAKALCLTNALMGIVPVNQYQQQVFEPSLCRSLQSLIKQGNS
ncbi:aminodeoxychorismate lyase [Psychromonas hadalis]|uniref:aminodeoxychorismate lyase n=1 Tax=Psychromonas hadalis TaxID=211669 RepID=UPI0003B39B31|nr:aminodeoxychorismate lyase [Psychromonas hadalis]